MPVQKIPKGALFCIHHPHCTRRCSLAMPQGKALAAERCSYAGCVARLAHACDGGLVDDSRSKSTRAAPTLNPKVTARPVSQKNGCATFLAVQMQPAVAHWAAQRCSAAFLPLVWACSLCAKSPIFKYRLPAGRQQAGDSSSCSPHQQAGQQVCWELLQPHM